MHLTKALAAYLAPLGLAALLALTGCSSKPAEVDTAEFSPDPSVKPQPPASPSSATPPAETAPAKQ